MWAVELLSKTIDSSSRRILVSARLTNGAEVINKTFDFPLYTTLEQIKRVIKQFTDEVDAGVNLFQEVPTGVVDMTGVISGSTAEQLAFEAWLRDVLRLEKLDRLINIGVFTGTETQIVNLRNKVKTDFKVSFVDKL